MSNGAPAQVSGDIVAAIKGAEVRGVVRLPERSPRLGDKVRIWRGVFAGQLGLFQGQRGSERVVVLLQMLGHMTLPRDDVEPIVSARRLGISFRVYGDRARMIPWPSITVADFVAQREVSVATGAAEKTIIPYIDCTCLSISTSRWFKSGSARVGAAVNSNTAMHVSVISLPDLVIAALHVRIAFGG